VNTYHWIGALSNALAVNCFYQPCLEELNLSKRVTIKSIARDLKISHMTVSRALSGSPHVKEETRKLVQLRAAELGYVKSAAATAMRGDGARIVGLLMPTLANEFYARFADSLAQHCESAGLQLIIHLTADKLEQERRSLLKLREVQAAAVVMVPTPGSDSLDNGQTGDMQVIQLIRTEKSKQSNYMALVDDRTAIIRAVKRLVESGHRRIGYLGGAAMLSSGKERLSAFISGLQEANIEPLAELVHTGIPSFAMGYGRAPDLVRRDGATALICGGFEISNGAVNGLLEQKLRLPAQAAFVGYGDPSYYRWLEGGISTVRIPVELLASETAGLIEAGAKRQEPNLRQRTVKAQFIRRCSCGPAQSFSIL
jgi:LacI family transcriptional regulator